MSRVREYVGDYEEDVLSRRRKLATIRQRQARQAQISAHRNQEENQLIDLLTQDYMDITLRRGNPTDVHDNRMRNAFILAKYIVEHQTDNDRILRKLNNKMTFFLDAAANANSRRYLSDMIEAINTHPELEENPDYNYLKEYITHWLEIVEQLQLSVQKGEQNVGVPAPPLIPYGENFISLTGGKRRKHRKRIRTKKTRRTRRTRRRSKETNNNKKERKRMSWKAGSQCR